MNNSENPETNYQPIQDPACQQENTIPLVSESKEPNIESPEDDTFEEACNEFTKINTIPYLEDTFKIQDKKVKPILFNNLLFNPQYDTFNPIFGVNTQKRENPEKELEMIKLFVNTVNDTKFESGKSTILGHENQFFDELIAPYVPLKKTPQENIHQINEKNLNENMKTQELRNEKIIYEVYGNLMFIIIKIILILFIFDSLPVFIASAAIDSKHAYSGIINFNDPKVQVVQLIFSIISYIIIIVVVKIDRNILESKYRLEFNHEFMFATLLTNLPQSTTLYDIIKWGRFLMGPNYGVVDIILINDYSNLDNIQDYMKEKEILKWDELHLNVRRHNFTEDDYQTLKNTQIAKIKEEMKLIKLGVRFSKAAIVLFQTQEIADYMKGFTKINNPCLCYNFNRKIKIRDNVVYCEPISEPFDLIWLNIGANTPFFRKTLISMIYVFNVAASILLGGFSGKILFYIVIYKADFYILAYLFPFILILLSMILYSISVLFSKILKLSSYSNQLFQTVAFNFPAFQLLILNLLSSMITSKNEVDLETPAVFGKEKEESIIVKIWNLHFVLGFFIALIILMPLKRVLTKNNLLYIYRLILMKYKMIKNIPFNRLEYEKYKTIPPLQWNGPMQSMMYILSFIFLTKYISIYSCFFAIGLTSFIIKMDSYLIKTHKVETPTIMIANAFFKILDHGIIILAFLNGLVPLVSGSFIGIPWIVFAAIWSYLNDLESFRLFCFEFILHKNNTRILENTKLGFVPHRYRNYIYKIDRNYDYCNILTEDDV